MARMSAISAEQRPSPITRAIEGTKKVLDDSTGVERSAKLVAAVIKFTGVFTKQIPEGLRNLGTFCTTVATGIGALGLIGFIYNLTHGFKKNSSEEKARTLLFGAASVIDLYKLGGNLGIIPAAKIAAAIGKIPVWGVVANVLTLNLLQSVIVITASACSLAISSKKLINAKKSMLKSAAKVKKWKDRDDQLKLVKSALPSVDSEKNISSDALFQKYQEKINNVEQILEEKTRKLSGIDSNDSKAKKEIKEIESEIASLKNKKSRWIHYTARGTIDIDALEKNTQYKMERWKTENTNASAQRKKSIFAIVADVCRVVSIIFATLISFIFPVAGFAISLAIASLSLVSNSIGLMKFIQDKLFNKENPLPERPSLALPVLA
jgi:hypothetical protein